MSNILNLALKVTGDATGLAKSLTPAERALDALAKQADKAASAFDPLAAKSAAAAQAQDQFAEKFAALAEQLQSKVIAPQEYAAAFGQLAAEAKDAAKAFEEGIKITQQNSVADLERIAKLERLNELLELGAIDARNFGLESAKIGSEGATETERFAEAVRPLVLAFGEGKVSAEEFAAQSKEIAAAVAAATPESERSAAAILALSEQLEAGTIKIEQYREEFSRIQSGDIKVAFDLQVVGVQEGVEASSQLRDALAKLGPENTTITVDVQTNADEEAQRVADLVAEHEEYKKALDEGARLAEKYRDVEADRAAEIEKINNLLEKGVISEELAAKARADVSGEAARAAEAEKELASAREQAARIIEASLSGLERAQRSYDSAVELAQSLEERGLLTKEQLNAEIERQADLFAKAAIEAGKTTDETTKAGDAAGEAGLKFNELSGFLGLLPGPVGAFASRLSSLASSAEGLGKILENPAQAVAGFGNTLAALATPAGIATAAIAGLGAAAAGLKSLEGELESLTNTANKLGVSFQFVETLKQSAEMAGVSFGTVNTAMTRLLRTLAGADEESKKAANSLKAVGLSFDDIKDKSSEEQIRLIGERLNAIEDPAKRAAAATAVFGRAGAELLPAFENLAVGEKTLDRFNARIADIDRNRVLALGDSFDAVSASIKGFGNELLTPFIGVIQSLSDGFATTIATIGRNIGSILDIFSPLASAIGGAVNVILQFGATLSNIIGTALEPFAAAGRLIASVFDAQSRAITEVFGRINDAINGFREFFKFNAAAEYANKVFDQLRKTLERVLVIVTTAFQKIGAFASETFSSVVEFVSDGVNAFLELIGIGGAIDGFVDGVVSAFAGLWDGIKFVVGQVGGFIERVLKFAEDWLGIVPKIEEPVKATVNVDDGGALEEILKENKEFQKTLDSITQSVSSAIDESVKFGQAGFDAALKYQEAIRKLKDDLDRGLFNEETFKREAEKAGASFKQELARIEEENKLDLQINADVQKTLGDIQQKISGAVDEAVKFGEAGQQAALTFQQRLTELGEQFESGILNQAALNAEIAKATAEYNKQIDGIKQIEQLQANLLKQDQDRVSALLSEGNTQTKLEKDIEAVLREQLRVEEQIRQARESGRVFEADAATARLAQLDQLQAKLEDQQQAVEQGFGEGFQKAFDETTKGVDALIVKAQQFGNVGAFAAQALQSGIEAAQQQVRDDILTKETYQKEVARQQDLFNQRLAAAQRVEDFLSSKLDQRQRAELEAVKALEERKKQSEVNVQAIRAKIIDEEKKLEEARGQNNLQGARAAQTRINQLRQAERAESALARGQSARQSQQMRQFDATFARGQQFMSRQISDFTSAINSTYSAANASIAAVDAVNEALARQAELMRPVQGAVSTADVRTAEGAALVLGLGTSQQDPALIEARLQTKQLKGIQQAILGAVNSYINTPVEIA